jgi:hypothetical protein
MLFYRDPQRQYELVRNAELPEIRHCINDMSPFEGCDQSGWFVNVCLDNFNSLGDKDLGCGTGGGAGDSADVPAFGEEEGCY